jgi:hypothetical protein
MSLQCFFSVSRTGWVISAITACEWTNTITINLYKPYQDFAHFVIFPQCVFIDVVSSSLFFRTIRFCARTTISTPANASWCCRKLSRINLFIRLRCTAKCRCFFEIARPNLAIFLAFLLASTRKLSSTDRYAESKTCRYSDALVSLSVLGNPLVR